MTGNTNLELDKLLINALQQYKTQEISLERASEICKVSIREMMEILQKYGVGSNMNKEDYVELTKGIEL